MNNFTIFAITFIATFILGIIMYKRRTNELEILKIIKEALEQGSLEIKDGAITLTPKGKNEMREYEKIHNIKRDEE